MKELVVPIGLLAIMASMLLPLPPALLDIMIIGNVLLGLMLLVSTLYLTDSLKLSVLPTLLLLATLYRLSLNVATTRLILSGTHAGEVIEAFGSVVIGGNLIVGLVIFLVITLIQFIVIAKGSERVAEVAARFTLDALPGKQMSIDADVRAGLIDFETARERRNEMQTESRFYGALDGAMKFVKGDAIAGLVITGVNLVGGLLLGLVVYGMDPVQAFQKFSLLTIGDGLVSQIPALLNALAAGIVVTRVGRGGESTVASDLLSQLGQIRAAKIILACLALLLAVIPGMPVLPLILAAGTFLFFGLVKTASVTDKQKVIEKFEPRSVPALEIIFPTPFAQQLVNAGILEASITKFRREAYEKFGLIVLPPEPSTTTERMIEIKVRGLVVRRELIEGDAQACSQRLILVLLDVVRQHLLELLDDTMTRRLLDAFDKEAPELVASVIPSILSVTAVTELMKQLVRDGVSLRHFNLIVQGVAETQGKVESTRGLLADIRIALGRHIVADAVVEGRLSAHTVEGSIDLLLSQVERGERTLDLEWAEPLIRELHVQSEEIQLMIVSKGSRALLKQLLKARNLNMPVFCFEEIPEDIPVDIIGTVQPQLDEEQIALKMVA